MELAERGVRHWELTETFVTLTLRVRGRLDRKWGQTLTASRRLGTIDEHWLLWESRSQGCPPVFLVSISRPWSQKSQFLSRYQDSNVKSLDNSLSSKTQISKDLITVSISRLYSWISNLFPNLVTVPKKSCLRETLNLLTDADNSTDTKYIICI